METYTDAQLSSLMRFHAWCDTCQEETDSTDTTAKWCAVCGIRRD